MPASDVALVVTIVALAALNVLLVRRNRRLAARDVAVVRVAMRLEELAVKMKQLHAELAALTDAAETKAQP